MTSDVRVLSAFNTEIHDALIAKARGLRPLLEKSAAEHERRGELLPEVVAALDEAGFFKMPVPRRWGGLCVSSYTMMEATAELAKGCPSTAWVVSIVTNAVWSASVLPLRIQEVMFRDGVPRICSPQNGMGKLESSEGKMILNGRWSYASASHHASWAVMPAMSPEGKLCFAAAPMSQLRIELTWDVAGMKGTGSDTVVAENVVIDPVLIHHVPLDGSREPLRGHMPEPTDYWVVFPLLRGKATSVLLGIAEGLLECVLAGRDRPLIYSTYERRKDSAVWHAGAGEAAAMIGVARTICERQHHLFDDAALQGRILTYPERAKCRGEGAVIVQMLIDAVEKLMNLSGSSAYLSSNPIQRYWRDFSIAARHIVFNVELGYEVYGKQLMGIEPNVVGSEAV